jgi:cytoskeletal protein RodZ
MTNFGARLKQARESRGISLDQIAAETRISTRFLNAIENEQFNLLPGGIFNRGFVRAFAEKVGLNPDETVADYERLTGSHHPVEAAPAPPPAPTPTPVPAPVHGATPAKKGRNLYPVALIALFVVVVAVFYIVTRESDRTSQTASPATQSQAAATPAPVPAQAPPETAPAPEPQTPVATAEPVVKRPQPQPPPAPAPATSGQSLTLEIEAREETWIKVISDGNTVNAGEVLQPGMARKFTAQNTLKLSVGNAAGLNLKLNDKSMKPIGKSGQVRELTITPATAKDFIG